MPRILLALQYWEGDRARAGELARFIVDLEKKRRKNADFLLSARFDCAHDPDVVARVSTRFKTFTSVGKTTLSGYPDGSFGLWHDTLEAVRAGYADGSMPRYDCVLTFEADCTPLCRDWIDALLAAWERDAAPDNRAVIGQLWTAEACDYPHINGNMLVSGDPEHLGKITALKARPGVAWDLDLYSQFKLWGGAGTKSIASFYVRSVGDRWFEYTTKSGAAFFHGDKDGMARCYVEHVLLGRPKPSPVGALPPDPKAVPCLDGLFRPHPTAENLTGVWTYRDSIRSVTRQGLRAWDPPFQSKEWRHFNPGLLKVGERRYLMPYRFIHRETDDCGIRMAVIQDGKVESDAVINLPGWADHRPPFVEDPRIVQAGGKVLLSYTLSAYFPQSASVQRLVEIDPDSFAVRAEIPLGHIGNNTGAPSVREKNWTFFEGPGDALFCLYSLSPHRVHEVSSGRRFQTNQDVFGEWRKKYGDPRGGTPPVKVGDRWYVFFHSCRRHASRRRRYYAGCYSFRWTGTHFESKSITRAPLLTASTEDGFLWPEKSCFWEPIVIFPSGAHFDAPTGKWKVAAGVNDCFLKVFEVPHSDLLRKMS